MGLIWDWRSILVLKWRSFERAAELHRPCDQLVFSEPIFKDDFHAQ